MNQINIFNKREKYKLQEIRKYQFLICEKIYEKNVMIKIDKDN